MAKKFFPRALSVGLSLAMCASMVAPAFAAVALDKNMHIGAAGELLAHDEEGNVAAEGGTYDYYLEEDIDLDKTLVIEKDVEATIDLNGHELSLYDDVDTDKVEPGNYATHGGYGSVIKVEGELTVKDTDENGGNDGETGTITGGFALHGGGGVDVNGGTLNLVGGEISGNATFYGGGAGVYVHNEGTFKMSGGEISENTMSAPGVGGGVRVENGKFNMTGGTIKENVAADGGGVAVKDGSFTMSGDATIDNNVGKYAGGGVYLDSSEGHSSDFTMNGGTISNNTTGGYGGGVAAYPLHNDDGGDRNSFTMTGGSITKNHADNDVGGGVSIRYGDFTMTGGEITDNTAKTLGGGVHSYFANTTIKGGTISGNSLSDADSKGGGVFLFGANNVSSMTGGTITGNKANAGAGVHVDNTTFNLSGGKVTGNTAGSYGGGVSAVGTNGKINMSGSADVSGNTAGTYGGGVYLYNGANFVLSSGSVDGNTSKFGGGVFNWLSNVQMKGGEIKENTGISGGAGLYNFSKATFELTGGDIIDNHGNGVYNYSSSTFKMSGGNISGNSSTNGGGVYNNKADFEMTGGKLYGNSASNSGDDIYNKTDEGGSITLIVAEDMGAKIDGETIDRWLWDAAGARYKDNNYLIPSLTEDAVLCLKAAPSQFFTVTVSNGYNNELILNEKLERNTAFPAIDEPTRTGYTFVGWSIDLPELVNGEINLVAQWELIPVIEDPVDPAETEAEEEIDDAAVPLASGPITRAQFIDYLWRHEGEPASDGVCTFTDVAEDHEFVLALAWAEQNGVAAAYADGTFEPDELVTTDAVREFLGNFAQVFGTNAIAVGELTTLSGEAGEAVLNCDEVLAEFFGEEYAPAETDGIEIAA